MDENRMSTGTREVKINWFRNRRENHKDVLYEDDVKIYLIVVYSGCVLAAVTKNCFGC